MSAPSVPGYDGLALIGKGGFSRVYRAEQSKLKRHVAIKVLNFGLNDEADRRSFERETELMGRVSTHPNIVTVHDTAFTAQGQPCIVMEHYRGGSLAELIGEAGRLSPKEVLEVGVAIASALDASHGAGVLHCDLKPQNILISDFGQAALGDFGISTFAEERTRTGSDAGAGFTLAYAAPEIVEGESPSVATDLYSLAATLYTSLAGHRPFIDPATGTKPTPAEHARRILLESVPALTDTPDEVGQVILSAMSKDPDKRPGSAAEFAIALYQVGQRLGYGTPAPSTLSRAALPVLDPLAEPVEPAAQIVPVDPDERDPFAPDGQVRPMPPANADLFAPKPSPVSEGRRALDDAGTVQPSAPAAPQPVASVEAFAPAPQRTPGRGFVPDGDATVHRADVDLEPVTAPIAESESDSGPSRRGVYAALIGLVSLLLVAGVLFLFTRGGGEEVADEPETVIATPRPAAPLIAAPNRPTDVEIQRLGVTRVRVSWEPAADTIDGAGLVSFEVRRQGDPEVYETLDSEFVLDGVAANEAPCVTVVAVRGNRVSPATDPICLAPQVGASIAVRPETCEPGDCEVRVILNDFAANSRVAVLVLDPDGRDINGFGDVYETQATTDSRARIDDWRLSLPPLFDAGEYLVVVADDVGETFSALLTVAVDE